MGQLFDEAFPQYLAMGMSYEQFWEQDCTLVIPYRKAFQIRQEEINNTAWLNGLYIWKALQCAPLFVNGFVPKGASIEPYFDKPINFTPEKKKPKRQTEEEIGKQNAISHMQKIASLFNAQIDRKKQAERLMTNPPGKE